MLSGHFLSLFFSSSLFCEKNLISMNKKKILNVALARPESALSDGNNNKKNDIWTEALTYK